MLKTGLVIHIDRSKPDRALCIMVCRSGFTLIELTLVVFLLGVTMTLAIPRIHQSLFSDQASDEIRWLTNAVRALKAKSIEDRMDYTLHIDIDNNNYWISNATMTEEERQAAMARGYQASDDIRILDVDFPKSGKTFHGTADILFYQNGYSEKVLLHIEEDLTHQKTLLIEPFLKRTYIYDGYVGFEG